MLNKPKIEEKKIIAWFRTLSEIEKARVMQPYFTKYSINGMPLITLFKNINYKSKLEIYEKEKNK